MVPSKLYSSVALSLVALPFVNAVHVIFGGTQPVVRTRLDPILSPGSVSRLFQYHWNHGLKLVSQVSTHVHDVFGGSGFSANYDYNQVTQAQCTTTVIPQDLSNYWVVCIASP